MLAASSPVSCRDHHSALQHWRRQRRRLQSNLQRTFCRTLESLSDTELEQQLDRLCRDLVDYLSIGHGRVYGHYCAARGEHAELLHNIRLHLGRTTDAALRFNRRCETTPAAALQGRLQAELGRLSKTLSLRFALEEQLLELGAASRPSRQERTAAVPQGGIRGSGRRRGCWQQSP
jgi:regulator of sigma D